MTFSIPKELATQFIRRVPARDRSHYVAEALALKLKDRDRTLAHACDVANRSRQVRNIEREFDTLPDETAEPWDEPAARTNSLGARASRLPGPGKRRAAKMAALSGSLTQRVSLLTQLTKSWCFIITVTYFLVLPLRPTRQQGRLLENNTSPHL